MAREGKKIRIVLDHPDAETVFDQLERQFTQVYSQGGLEKAAALANAKKEVRREVQWLMAMSVKNPEETADDNWVKNRANTLQKQFTGAPEALCDACAISSGKLLTIMCESLAHPLPKINQKKVRQNIDIALKQPATKQLLTRTQKIREKIYIACNPDMAIEVVKDFALQDVYEKLGYVEADYVHIPNPKYVRRFFTDTRTHLQNLRRAFPEAPYQLCKAYVDCWDELQAIMTEAHGGYWAQ